eukprot:m.282150 g.282150  ORF g.282150 m.282150 type:complete len:264 (+) comp40651_c0_seq67:4139-4930(+)
MLIALLVFLVNADNGLQNGNACTATALLLHYFWLTTSFWMSVEAVNMYISLVKVFGMYVHRFVLKAGIFAWGSPLAVVAVTALVTKMKSYSKTANDKTCRMTGQAFYYSFYAILGAVLLFNLVVFVLLMIRLAPKEEVTRIQRKNKSSRAKMGIAITVLLGLSWVFGMISIDEDDGLAGTMQLVFQYLFAITASLQGFLIFVFYCCLRIARNEKAPLLQIQRRLQEHWESRTSPPRKISPAIVNQSYTPAKSPYTTEDSASSK